MSILVKNFSYCLKLFSSKMKYFSDFSRCLTFESLVCSNVIFLQNRKFYECYTVYRRSTYYDRLFCHYIIRLELPLSFIRGKRKKYRVRILKRYTHSLEKLLKL